jgi:hypothetical protein
VPNEEKHPLLTAVMARELLLGRRESLTIAGELGVPVTAVNETLLRLRGACGGCIALSQPYAGEPRVVVTVVLGESLRRVAWNGSSPSGRDSG